MGASVLLCYRDVQKTDTWLIEVKGRDRKSLSPEELDCRRKREGLEGAGAKCARIVTHAKLDLDSAFWNSGKWSLLWA